MEIVHEYVKLRSDFGRQCLFSDRHVELLVDLPPNPKLAMQFVLKETRDLGVQGCWEMSEHEVNTERIEYDIQGINHVEGGWPKDINSLEMEQTIRFRKKVEKDEIYMNSIQVLGELIAQCVGQNNAVDIYQEYFKDEELLDEIQEAPSVKIVNKYRDPNQVKRNITCLSWQPSGGSNLAAAYSCLEWQKATADLSKDSYIWDIESPNKPRSVLKPTSQLVCLAYNPQDLNFLVSGSLNGQIMLWDPRAGQHPTTVSPLEKSHMDPVYEIIWLQSATETEAFSASTDGQILWWDVRQMSEPTERLMLDLSRKENPDNALGAISMAYSVTMPDTFIVGTEQGAVVYCNRAAETPAEKIVCTYDGHHGPVYAIQKNPFFSQNFLTVGDWGARIWSEDIKESSIMWTKHQTAYLTDACWSPVRPSLFFTVKMDGVLDIWDILFKQNDPTLSVKVRDEPLCCVQVHEAGSKVVSGSQLGVISLMEISKGLCTQQNNEQALLGEMLERETKREKILRAQKVRDEAGNMEESPKELILRPEYDFYNLLESEQRRKQWETRQRNYP
ncbi:dynein intermediate chain 2, axonemal-like isoform X1 [Hippocampus comes]|uniref:dynein intermediate chain 2, axonemal-like isoform X1 n=2 Tax=Hippocampus comes TaxID=109280 RepID=UPI00094F35A7|nr:PREDICTED: dynein intermediate chain 2, axonemal-like isoform X1 [Hippocampus comes]